MLGATLDPIWSRIHLGFVLAFIGCTSYPTEAELRAGLVHEDFCKDEGMSFSVQDVNPAETWDYWSWRSQGLSVEELELFGHTPPTDEELGAMTAMELEDYRRETFELVVNDSDSWGTCDAFEGCDPYALPSEDGFWVGYWGYEHLAFYGGGQMNFALDLEGVRAFFGSIDTPSEAALLARVLSYSVTCNGPNYLETPTGHLLYSPGACDGTRGRLMEVTREGTIRMIASTGPREATCIF